MKAVLVLFDSLIRRTTHNRAQTKELSLTKSVKAALAFLERHLA